jgi:tetratricopeptide (TPR) repeat protein
MEKRGDYGRAISDLDEAIRLDPKAFVYNNRGDTYRRKGDYDRAISDYDQVIELDPTLSTAYARRGEAYEAKNDLDHALADFDQALKLYPSLANAQRGRGRAPERRKRPAVNLRRLALEATDGDFDGSASNSPAQRGVQPSWISCVRAMC